MSWSCEELSGERYEFAKPACDADKGQRPYVLACGDEGKRDKITCLSRSDPRDQFKYKQMLGLPVQSSSSLSPVFALESSPSFFSPSRRFDVSLARRNLFDELRSYQPRSYVPDNIDIFNAVKGGLFDNVYSYVNRPRINLNPRDRAGNTPLITALLDNNNKASALLIIKGANVNTSNNAGLTPLMAAASNNNELMVDVLLKKGANRSARTINGMTASDFTTDPDIKLLIQRTTTRKSSKRRSKSSRRRSKSSKRSSSKKPCRADQVRNRETGRCRKR